MKDAFMIVEVSPTTANQWLVRGRAYDDVKVDETIFVVSSRIGNIDSLHPFKIVGCSTYGKTIDFLNAGLTGDLLLEGAHGEVLKDTGMLVKP